jgi:2-polyprenyl-3-methyl-5-hydroxy-6-metoxy-1,4-benzoquinol methylase
MATSVVYLMTSEQIKEQLERVRNRFGNWTAHNIRLDESNFTVGKVGSAADELKAKRILQIVSDLSKKPLNNSRVLDLACLEGLYCIELARHGAESVGIEGRSQNFEKAKYSKEALNLNNLKLHLDDVRNLTIEKYGEFDVVLCLGLLYHLDAPDVFQFVEKMRAVCKDILIIDTHISKETTAKVEYKGFSYSGKFYQEHPSGTSVENKTKNLWASLDNEKSFWPTRLSLFNLLARSGFTSVYECHNPAEPEKPEDRITLVALVGTPATYHSSQIFEKKEHVTWPEETFKPIPPIRNLSSFIRKFKLPK